MHRRYLAPVAAAALAALAGAAPPAAAQESVFCEGRVRLVSYIAQPIVRPDGRMVELQHHIVVENIDRSFLTYAEARRLLDVYLRPANPWASPREVHIKLGRNQTRTEVIVVGAPGGAAWPNTAEMRRAFQIRCRVPVL